MLGLFRAALVLTLLLAAGCMATPHQPDNPTSPVIGHQRSHKMLPRNIGSDIRDRYLMSVTNNFMCTKDLRTVPVDPETGTMKTGGLRKRGFGEWLLNMEPSKQKGLCDPEKATWIKLPGWPQPIPKAQAMAQFPWIFGLPTPVPTPAPVTSLPVGATTSAVGYPSVSGLTTGYTTIGSGMSGYGASGYRATGYGATSGTGYTPTGGTGLGTTGGITGGTVA